MRRETIAMRIKLGMKAEFKHRCKHILSKLIAPLKLCGINNFSIWCVEDLVFGYYEVNDSIEPKENKMVLISHFLEYMMVCCECLAHPMNNPMRLMYEDIGIIREDKSRIHHRVFVTKLKIGCAEEYKRRHDTLILSRNGKINLGPESNFTIWNIGDYIFGYCELDKSMEREPTEEEWKTKIAWETRMLEIMDWVTDDVDWLTGLKHDKIELIFGEI